MNLQDAIESSIALTAYDVIEKRGIPDLKKVGGNLAGSVVYEFALKKVNGMICQKLLPNNPVECRIAGRIIWTPVAIGLVQQYVMGGGAPNWGQLFMKSLISLGALSAYKMM